MKKIFLPFLYELITERLRDKKKSLNLTYREISYFDNNNSQYVDEKMLINIFNNKIHTKKNPYLMSDYYLEHLTLRLEFKSKLDLIWGDYENNEHYRYYFYNICNMLLDDFNNVSHLSNEAITALDLALSDYIPYAKNSALLNFISNTTFTEEITGTSYSFINYYGRQLEIISTSNKQRAFDNSLNRKNLLRNRDEILNDSINLLYWKCKDDFELIFSKFIEQYGYSLNKTAKNILNFINNEFLEMLNTYKPGMESLGLRVKEIILSDWISQEELSKSHPESMSMELFSCSTEYISKLEKLENSYLSKLNTIEGYSVVKNI